MPLLGIQPHSDELRVEATSEGQSVEGSVDRELAAFAAVWLRQYGGVARRASVPGPARVEATRAAAIGAQAAVPAV